MITEKKLEQTWFYTAFFRNNFAHRNFMTHTHSNMLLYVAFFPLPLRPSSTTWTWRASVTACPAPARSRRAGAPCLVSDRWATCWRRNSMAPPRWPSASDPRDAASNRSIATSNSTPIPTWSTWTRHRISASATTCRERPAPRAGPVTGPPAGRMGVKLCAADGVSRRRRRRGRSVASVNFIGVARCAVRSVSNTMKSARVFDHHFFPYANFVFCCEFVFALDLMWEYEIIVFFVCVFLALKC